MADHSICVQHLPVPTRSTWLSFTNPKDAPDIPEFRLVDMLTSTTDAKLKSDILSNFKDGKNLRVVVATVAFGIAKM